MNQSFTCFLSQFEASEVTKRTYTSCLNQFDKFLINDLPTQQKVEDFIVSMQKRGLSSATIAQSLSAIRAYFLWVKNNAPIEKRGLYDLIVEGPRIQPSLPEIPTGDQMKEALRLCKTPYERALLGILYGGALRIKEAMNLKVEDIDFKVGSIRISGEGGHQSIVPVGHKILKYLRQYILQRTQKVFTQSYGKHLRTLKKIGKRAGIKSLAPNLLRHARAADMLAEGVSMQDVKDFLRVKSFDSTLFLQHSKTKGLDRVIPDAFE